MLIFCLLNFLLSKNAERFKFQKVLLYQVELEFLKFIDKHLIKELEICKISFLLEIVWNYSVGRRYCKYYSIFSRAISHIYPVGVLHRKHSNRSGALVFYYNSWDTEWGLTVTWKLPIGRFKLYYLCSKQYEV